MWVKGPIEHRFFGSLFGIWIGLFLSKRYPMATPEGWAYLIRILILIGVIAFLLRIAFSCERFFPERIIPYVSIFGCLILLVNKEFFMGYLDASDGSDITMWQLNFIWFVISLWIITAEVGQLVVDRMDAVRNG